MFIRNKMLCVCVYRYTHTIYNFFVCVHTHAYTHIGRGFTHSVIDKCYGNVRGPRPFFFVVLIISQLQVLDEGTGTFEYYIKVSFFLLVTSAYFDLFLLIE